MRALCLGILALAGCYDFSTIEKSFEQSTVGQTPLTGVWSHGNTVVVVGNQSILHSDDDGKSFAPPTNMIPAASYQAVWGSGGDDVYAVATEGHILHSLDGGVTFGVVFTGPSALRAVWGTAAYNVYVAGDGGTVWHTIDRGSSWLPETTDTTQNLLALWGVSTGDVWAAGDGVLLHRNGKLESWSTAQMLDQSVRDFWGANPNDFYFAGEMGVEHGTQKNAGQLISVWGSESDDVYIAGAKTLLHSVDHGVSWTVPFGLSLTSETLYSVRGTSRGELFFVGDDGHGAGLVGHWY